MKRSGLIASEAFSYQKSLFSLSSLVFSDEKRLPHGLVRGSHVKNSLSRFQVGVIHNI